jgi:hypothetical protein
VVDGALDQDGGTVAPGTSVGTTTVNGNYGMASAGTLEIEIEGTGAAGTDYDQLDVNNGTVDFNADGGLGGQLEVVCDDYSAAVNDMFLIVDNDGSDDILGPFRNLPQNGTLDVACGDDIVTFQISYAGGDGNDVALTVTNVAPAPAAAAFEVAEVAAPIVEDPDALLL